MTDKKEKKIKTKIAIGKIQTLFGKKKLSNEVYFELHNILQEFLGNIEYTPAKTNKCIMCNKEEAQEGFEYCEFCEDRYNECKETGGF